MKSRERRRISTEAYKVQRRCASVATSLLGDAAPENSRRHNGSHSETYTLNELPQPQVFLTLGLENLKPEPSSVST